MTGEPPSKHLLADWLDLHQISAAQCQHILRDWPEPPPLEPRAAQTTDLTAIAVWDMASAALSAVFGTKSAHMELVRRQTKCVFQPDPAKYPRAFTLNEDGQGTPMVVCNYQAQLADLMVLAHEFGHAAQIIASGERFLPPVPREVCAFLAELAMLAYLQNHQPELHQGAQQVWLAAVAKSWHKDRHDLMQVLSDPAGLSRPYSYQWNYPIARALALNLWEFIAANPAGGEAIWPLFEGRLDSGIAGLPIL